MRKSLIILSLLWVGYIQVQAESFDDAYSKITSLRDKNLLAQGIYYSIYSQQVGQARNRASNMHRWRPSSEQAREMLAQDSNQAKRARKEVIKQAGLAAQQVAKLVDRAAKLAAQQAGQAATQAAISSGWSGVQRHQIASRANQAELVIYYSKIYKDLVKQKGSLVITVGPDAGKHLIDPIQFKSCALYSYKNYPGPTCVKK